MKFNVNEYDIRKKFEKYGKIIDVEINKNFQKINKIFALIEYS